MHERKPKFLRLEAIETRQLCVATKCKGYELNRHLKIPQQPNNVRKQKIMMIPRNCNFPIMRRIAKQLMRLNLARKNNLFHTRLMKI